MIDNKLNRICAAEDEKWMNEALNEAKKALENNDVPIGAVIVFEDRVIGRGFNRVEKDNNSTAHAELIAINEAIKEMNYKHLLDCTLYTTLEPCPMCAGAIVLSRIPMIVIGTDDPKAGAAGSVMNILENERLNHKCNLKRGILKEECSALLKEFFKELRRTPKNLYK